MATDAQNAAAAQSGLLAAAANAAALLAELDAVPISQRARMTYSVGVRTYSWNEYRASLLAELKDVGPAMEALAKAAQVAAGPFAVIGAAQDGSYG